MPRLKHRQAVALWPFANSRPAIWKLRRGVFGLGRLLLLLQVCVWIGCSGKSNSSGDLAAKQLGRLGLWYGMSVGQNKGKPPTTIEQVRKYGESRITSEELSALGVTKIDDLFVSPRDGLPYKMVEYKKALPAPTGDPVVVFYEQKGQGGARRVALLGGGTLDVEDEKMATMVPSFKP